jgi:hypothetical protein
VEGELLLDTLLERLALLQSEGIGLGNDGNDVDDIRQLLKNNNIDGLEAIWMSRVSSIDQQITGLTAK